MQYLQVNYSFITKFINQLNDTEKKYLYKKLKKELEKKQQIFNPNTTKNLKIYYNNKEI